MQGEDFSSRTGKLLSVFFLTSSLLGFLINKEKIKPGPYPRYNIHRRDVLLRQGHYHAYSRENCEIKGCNHSVAGRKSVSKAVPTNTRPDGFLHRNYIECKVTNDTNTTSPVVLVESGIQRPRNDNSPVTSFERASELVVIGSKHCQGHIFVSNSSQQNNCHSCIHSDVGQQSGSSDHTRFLAGRTERTAHKLSGVGGSSLDYEKLPSSVEKSMCSVPTTQQEFNTFVVREELNHLSCVTKLGILAVGYKKISL